MKIWTPTCLVVLMWAATTVCAAEKNPVVVMETTSGDITIELFADKAPITVKNFLKYADDKFYDGTIFHRVIPRFIIQGGGYKAEMKKQKARAPIKNESSNGLSNKRGTIAMARRKDADTATSQFFISVKDNSRLDKANFNDRVGYCVFGRVTKGLDIVDKITQERTTQRGMFRNVPEEEVEIVTVRRVKAKPGAAGVTLTDVIAQVKKNEALYRNIEVHLVETYDIGKRKAQFGANFTEAQSWKKEIRSVILGGKYRVDVEYSGVMADGKKPVRKKQGIYDGKSTFSLSGEYKKTTAGSQDHVDLVRPHTLMFSGRSLRVPLSVYLSGHQAMHAYPGSKYDRSYFLDVKYEGVKKHKERDCHVVRVTMSTHPKNGPRVDHNADVFWLDPKRNYLPVRILGYTNRWSKTIPVGDYEVAEFDEIRPGVWFPIVGKINRWQSFAIKRQQKKLLQWRKTYTVDDVSLNPKRDAKYFAIPK